MDLPDLPTGLALLAFTGAAASVLAWRRGRRRAELRHRAGAAVKPRPPTPSPPAAERAAANQAAARAVLEQAQVRAAAPAALIEAAPPAANVARAASPARAPGPAPQPISTFDGPAWAPTEPMPGIACELQFADTMPAAMDAGAASFADTMPAEMNFGTANFADTLVAELAAEARAGPVPDARRQPA